MVLDRDDHGRLGIFSRSKIAVIVRTRRKFEDRLKRPSPLKSDILAYIDYEKRLDSLIQQKVSAAPRDEGGNERMKTSISDHASVRRIIKLYRIATNRFKGDLSIWFEYLEFCRVRKNSSLRKVLARALRFHSSIPALWIFAASWELDHNLNAKAAGAIIQSGLRVCPTSVDLWVEYLRMELTYLHLHHHNAAADLGKNVGTFSRDGAAAANGQKECTFVHKEEEEFISFGKKQGEDDESEKTLCFCLEKGHAILRAVYKGSIAALPYSLSLRKKFLEILEASNPPHCEQMGKEILADMKNVFSKDPEYWDWLATLTCSDLDIDLEGVSCQVNKAIKISQSAYFDPLPPAPL